MAKAVLWLVTLVVTLPGGVAAQARETIRVPGFLEGLPFVHAVRIDNMLYLSGQIGVRSGTLTVVQGGAAAETRQTMENIRTVLEYAGSSLAEVVKCTVFLLTMDDYASMNEAYAEFFGDDPPARSTMAGTGLAFGARVEIECIATVER